MTGDISYFTFVLKLIIVGNHGIGEMVGTIVAFMSTCCDPVTRVPTYFKASGSPRTFNAVIDPMPSSSRKWLNQFVNSSVLKVDSSGMH